MATATQITTGRVRFSYSIWKNCCFVYFVYFAVGGG